MQHLEELLDSIDILSTSHLPPLLFPSTVLKNVTDYVLAIDHVTAYYDMKLATFGVDEDNDMFIAFPVLVKDHTSKPKTLYEIETVKVPIPDKNEAADSYSDVRYSKPYLAINDDYYIQLRIQELRMCKQIRHTYYCEEIFFLVKHKSKPIVKVPYSITSLLNWCTQPVNLSISIILQLHPVYLMVVHIYLWLTCLVQRDFSVRIIFIWPIQYLVIHMYW